MSLKLLNELAFEALKVKYPTMPVHALPFKRYSDKNANELEKSVVAFIDLNGGKAERVKNSGRKIGGEQQVEDVLGRKRTIGSSIYIKGTGVAGSADVHSSIPIVIAGVRVSISVKWEIKYGRDTQKKAQKKYQKDIEAAGGKYFIVKTFPDFMEKYTTLINSFT